MKKKFRVSFVATVDDEVIKHKLRGYIIDALATWGGQKDPRDPLFDGVNLKQLKLEEVKE